MLGSPVTCVVSCHGQLVCHRLSQSVAQQAGQGFQLKHNDPLAAAAMLTTLFKSAGASSVAAAEEEATRRRQREVKG